MVSSVGSNSFNSMLQMQAAQEDYREAVSDIPEKLVIDMDAGTAIMLGPDGQPQPVSKQQMEKILAEVGLKLDSKSKSFVATDGYNLSAAEVNASSVGGAPVLPSVGHKTTNMTTTNVNAVQNAFNRFGDQGIETNALMLQGLLAVLHSSQKDRTENMTLTNFAHNMKNLNNKVEVNAKENIIQANIAQAEKAAQNAWITGIISVVCAAVSCAGGCLGDSSKIGKILSAVGGASKGIATGIYQLTQVSVQEENTESRQKAERQEKEAGINNEIIEQLNQMVRDAASDNKDEMKAVMKLLQDVAQRKSDAVRAMNV